MRAALWGQQLERHAAMLGNDYQTARRIAYRIVLWQAGASVAAATGFFALNGSSAALAALAGGAIGTISSLIVALLVFGTGWGRNRVKAPQAIAKGLYMGEAIKFFLTIVGFVMTLGVIEMAPLPVFIGYLATFLMYWVALFVTANVEG